MTLLLQYRLVSSGDPLLFFLLHLWDWLFGWELGVANGSGGHLLVYRFALFLSIPGATVSRIVYVEGI
ncbi:hypothetical protein BV20DRAFT_962234 [Pilatotrama ljubarskyi]|nr:hypothetical protein BV20DRAFT_962234 [Pilatotrama ljubarskyi]